MQFSLIATALFASLAAAVALPEAETSRKIVARDTFDCQGSGLCASEPNMKRDCDIAVNTILTRNDDVNYGSAGSAKATDGAQRGHCKVFIAGASYCMKSGNDIWHDYQEIRAHSCGVCGSKHWGMNNECRTTINYVS